MNNEPIYNLLNTIDYPEDLRKLNVEQLPEVCNELRQDIIKELCCNPGHFAASLGTVELTVALHYVYNTPYVGNICMDVCMIDVTDIDCKEGDSVEIFGDHLPITVLSDVLGTIPYEVLTSVSTRVKRVYYQD